MITDATVNGILSPERAREVFANAKLSRRGNPVDLRRLYLFEQYQEIVGSRVVFVLQNNNLTSQEYNALKNDFREKGFVITTVRNKVFGAVIEKHVQQLEAAKVGGRGLRQMKQLFAGPCCVVFSNASDLERPTMAKDFADVAARYKSKLLVVGAKFDNGVLTADTLKDVINLPPLGQLRAELVGLLSQPAQALLGLLQRTPQSLLTTLHQHEQALKGDDTNPSDTPKQ
ncbi:hypothetical protein DFJ77DRAFT_459397 [Powellomyces hirtus]|nr:hypothetical protein DFJ77DRAFT_459397 [Powellomyces hirtus]